MKLHRLELEGFGPFRDAQTVDFDAFAEDGIFLITGRTGAGKSSVLDGVCFALYGGVPRYDGAEKRLRSDHCRPEDPTRVTLEFTAEGRRWRVSRSPEYERPKLRGGGMTKESHHATLEKWDRDQWVGVAARPVDVGQHLDEILGLSQQQFLQVILLAQNRFARFLLAKNDERQALLRTLFGTRTYEEYERSLEERRKDTERALAADGHGVRVLLDEAEREAHDAQVSTDDEDSAGDPDDLPGRLHRLVRAVERAEYRVETANRERDEAARAAESAAERERAAATLHRLQQERLTTRAELERREAETAHVEQLRGQLERARSAETLRAVLASAERTAQAARAAEDALTDARTACAAAGEDARTAEEISLRDDALTAALAACDDALGAERESAEIEADQRRLQKAVADAEQQLAQIEAQRRGVPDALAALDEEIGRLAGASAALEAAQNRHGELQRRLAAAQQAEHLAERLREAERVAVRQGAALQEAIAVHTRLLQRRLDGAAGELAATLADGEACPVCGSMEHPAPAPSSDDAVTDAQLEEAEAAKAAAMEADRAAEESLRAAREAHGEATARAGGDDVLTLERTLAEEGDRVSAASADRAERERLERDRAELAGLDAAAAREQDRLTADLAVRRQEAALSEQRAAALRDRVEAARGGFAGVADRRADLQRRRDLVRTLSEALADRALRSHLAAEAKAERDAALAESPFETAEDARAALLEAGERAAREEQVREHDTAVRMHKQRLLNLELELVDASDEPVDLLGPASEVAAARQRFATAVAAASDAVSVAGRLRGLAQRADEAHHRIAERAEEFAVLSRLANTVAGRAPNTLRMTLETFVLAAELEEIVTAANLRLDEMSAGRYRLRHTDARAARGAASGLGLEVIDAFTGQPRPPQSLSGGETFLASLALALGLAEVVTARAGGIRLDTLFIDEGFGSLDDETLDTAMRVLDELRQGGRTVGVISHVAAMKEQLPAQLVVSATPQGPSIIRHGTLAPAR